MEARGAGRKGDREMTKRACEISPEMVILVDEFMKVFQRNIEKLIAGGIPLSEYSGKDRKDVVILARDAALDSDERFRSFLAPAWESRMKQIAADGCAPPAQTNEQKLGAYMQGKIGGVVSRILDGSGDGKHRGFTGILARIADMVDIIYPDDVMAALFDMTDDGVSTARNTIREDGYIIERIDGSSVGDTITKRSWWHVVARPMPEPEPEPADPRIAELQRIFPDATPDQIGFMLGIFGK